MVTEWEVLYPHREQPWAGRWRRNGRAEYGLYDPVNCLRVPVDPKSDPKLPGLQTWLTQGEMISYRPGRRATIRLANPGSPDYVKVVPLRRVLGLADTYRTVIPRLRPLGIDSPDVKFVDASTGAIGLSPLSGQVLHDLLGVGVDHPSARNVDYVRIGNLLGQMATGHEAGLRPRTWPDLAWWVAQVLLWDPQPAMDFEKRLSQAVSRLRAITPGGENSFVHGDLHDRNLVVQGDGSIGLLDLDGAGSGDPEQDLVTLTAHLELRALQHRRPPPTNEIGDLWEGFEIARDATTTERTRAATAAELIRLACLYRFRRRWRPMTSDLLNRAHDWNAITRVLPIGSATTEVTGTVPAWLPRVSGAGKGPLAALRQALGPGEMGQALMKARLPWFEGPVTAAEVGRVTRRDGGFEVEIDAVVETNTGPPVHHRLIGEIVAGDTEAALRGTEASLVKKRRSQLSLPGHGLAALPALAMVVRTAGLDRRLPLLDFLHRPKLARRAMKPIMTSAWVATELLSHRLGKRATLRIKGEDSSVVIKGYKYRSDLAATAYKHGLILWESGGTLGGPRPLHLLEQQRALVWEDVGATGRDEFDIPPSQDLAAIGQALRRLHGLSGLGGPEHGLDDELALLRQSADLARDARPELAVLVGAAGHRVEQAAAILEPSKVGPIHRDAHPGQFLNVRGRTLIIDLDTLSIGDPALDLGNLSAYLTLGGAAGLCEHLMEGYGADAGLQGRAEVWTTVSLFRIALQAVISTRRAEAGRVLLEGLAG